MKPGDCKHFNGVRLGAVGNDECKAGVNYRDLIGTETGCILRLPCINRDGEKLTGDRLELYQNRPTCQKFEAVTDQDLADERARVRAAIERLTLALPIINRIKQERAGQSWRGTVACPACNGELVVTHAKINGHVWGRCETPGCLSWME